MQRKCLVENCGRKYYARGCCEKHYYRLVKTGDPLKTPSGKEHGKRSICTIEECGDVVEGHGFCHKHNRKFKKYGNPLMVNRPNLGKHRYTREGYQLIWNPSWPSARKDGYVLEHRQVVENKLKRSLMKSEIVHHINGIRNDNRLSNLEVLNVSRHYKGHTKIICKHCGKEAE